MAGPLLAWIQKLTVQHFTHEVKNLINKPKTFTSVFWWLLVMVNVVNGELEQIGKVEGINSCEQLFKTGVSFSFTSWYFAIFLHLISQWILFYQALLEVSMNKIALWINVRVDNWTAEWTIIVSNAIASWSHCHWPYLVQKDHGNRLVILVCIPPFYTKPLSHTWSSVLILQW